MKEAPFIRLVIPLIIGIVTVYYFNIPVFISAIIIGAAFLILFLHSFLPPSFKFKYPWVAGILLNILLFAFGALLTSFNDSSPAVKQLEKLSSSGSPIIVSISEPLSEKPKSWKALSEVNIHPSTNILVYFKKDAALIKPEYGDKIAFIKPISSIENLHTFGTFDYKKYCALKNIHYQVFLKPNEFVLLKEKDIDQFQLFLFKIQHWVNTTIKQFVPGKKESGLAEALLIGYKDDLDKELIKSYSNTGVIHVVAISGLHLGLIYLLLKYICLPLPSIGGVVTRSMLLRKKNLTHATGVGAANKLPSSLIIISALWIFSLLAGGSPSVLRSAVMFTFIIAGESFSRNTSIYNNLAASAFFLLAYNPYWLWDLGFQLSYAALLSIVIFQKPIYNLFIPKNKILNSIWKLNAVTISAQILTTPICIFYFSQFPNLFLITNFIAVPLSSIILFGEIILCTITFLPWLAILTGKALHYLIYFMNTSIEYLGGLPFSLTNNLIINLPQLIIIYSFILFTSFWLIKKDRHFVSPALICAILFFAMNLFT